MFKIITNIVNGDSNQTVEMYKYKVEVGVDLVNELLWKFDNC